MKTSSKPFVIFLLLACTAKTGSSSELLSLPSAETTRAIEGLHLDLNPKIELRDLAVGKAPDRPNAGANAPSSQSPRSVPFVAANSMILQFQPDTSQAQINDYLQSNNLPVVKTFPSIGAVQVKTDLTKFFHAEVTDKDQNETLLRGLVEASQSFKKDPRIREATPDIVMQGQQETLNLSTPSLFKMNVGAGKVVDWGINDIQADQLWTLPGASDGVIFGIMDVGFSKHEDLVFLPLDPGTPIEDHGTHVAGIACGSHALPRGTEGVLPNCIIRAKYGDVFFQSAIGAPPSQFIVIFSQILGTLDTFVREADDVSTFNLSLGYNWQPNFLINPEAPENALYRQNVEIQGSLAVSMLRAIEKKDKVVFSSAGNDSQGLHDPVGAKYASPFNWAAIVGREAGIKNAVIVEAHDQNGKRANFSNNGGDISCPGVDILSTVAFDAKHEASGSAYGTMSGTSMASPYCAAGLALFRLVRPKYTGDEAIECILKSSAKSSSGTPMMRLGQAIKDCP